jgi:hypothetical protein
MLFVSLVSLTTLHVIPRVIDLMLRGSLSPMSASNVYAQVKSVIRGKTGSILRLLADTLDSFVGFFWCLGIIAS